MNKLRVGIAGFNITPRFHPTCGAWGCTPNMTELDMPLLARCIVFDQDDCRLVWFGSDLVGETVPGTDAMRAEVATALGMDVNQIVWSTSQTHSSGAIPGSVLTGSSICDLSKQDPTEFMANERRRLMGSYVKAARDAIGRLQPVVLNAGRAFCDTISYNTRFPMPTGGVKFSRHHDEGLQSGKFFDPELDLVRFDDLSGKPIGAIFNFCSHPATMINDKMISPDWVGTTRQLIESALGGAPTMYLQGFCGDVNCHHIFGTPTQARRTGERLGKVAVAALPNLIPLRTEPFDYKFETIQLACRPMYTRQELLDAIDARQKFIDSLADDPAATWFCGINAPDRLTVPEKVAFVGVQMKYLQDGLRMLEADEKPRTSLPLRLGAIRIGDIAAVISPGENFTATGQEIRRRSPFIHTMIGGDTNGLFGYIGTDDEIPRGGYETDSFWKMGYFEGFRLAPAEGAAPKIINCCVGLLQNLQKEHR